MNNQSRPLRIAFVASSLELAGAGKQVCYMARALHRAGIEVHFFYLGSGGYYESLLREAAVAIHPIYVPNRPWLMLITLMKALCRLRPQIVLAAQFGDLRFAAVAGRLCRALVLGGIRSDGFYELKTHGFLSWWLAQWADGLVANSYRATQNLVFRGIKPQKIEMLPNVIDLQDFDRQAALPSGIIMPPDRIIFAAVGSLQPCKRFDRFLEALAMARSSEPSICGVIAGGDRGLRVELQAKAHALGLTPHLASHYVEFLGEFDRVPALLTQVASLVLTSDYEGFPNVILEAMAARAPVISVPAGDASLIVQHGQTGYVVGANDTPSMAKFMVQLARSRELRKNLGEAGRRRVEQQYSYASLAERLVGVIHRLARQNRRCSICELLEHSPAIIRSGDHQLWGRGNGEGATRPLNLGHRQPHPFHNGAPVAERNGDGVPPQAPSSSASQWAN